MSNRRTPKLGDKEYRNAVLDHPYLSTNERAVLQVYGRYLDWEKWTTFVGRETVAAQSGMSIPTFKRTMNGTPAKGGKARVLGLLDGYDIIERETRTDGHGLQIAPLYRVSLKGLLAKQPRRIVPLMESTALHPVERDLMEHMRMGFQLAAHDRVFGRNGGFDGPAADEQYARTLDQMQERAADAMIQAR